MIRTQHPRPARPGFTLVELMVAAAICVIIMTILAVCFQTAIDAMREMRSAGDMTGQLRAAGELMKRDFQADHFLPVDNPPNNNPLPTGRQLNNYRFDVTPGPLIRGGFYQIVSPASTYEGRDDNGFDSYRANGHTVWFTSVLAGGTEESLYSVVSPAGGTLYTSRAAEVAYFLGGPGGVGSPSGSANGVPTFNLYRRLRLVAMTGADKATLPNDTEVVSIDPNSGTVNAMTDLATAARRPGSTIGVAPAPMPLSGGRYGDDIILSNVLSFEVKATGTAPAGTLWPRSFGPNWTASSGGLDTPVAGSTTTDYPYDTLALFPGARFDTTSPPPIRVIGLQVRVRVYDPKLKSARQATYIFAQ